MGELSQRIGKKLEHYGNSIFEHLEWKILAQDVQIDCIRAAHKNAKSSDKKTHGVDILAGYYNPFAKRQEAFIIECKHREWSNFIPSNLSLWVEELCNTIECASTSPALTTYLEEYTLIGGILLYNSSDNIYEMKRALKSISQIKVPRRRHPLMIYLADNSRLEKWCSFNAEIAKIKQNSIENSFGIIYPSIGGSTWDRSPVVTPTYLFSDYILASYIKSVTNQGITTKVDIKALFCFEHVTDDSLKYLQDTITGIIGGIFFYLIGYGWIGLLGWVLGGILSDVVLKIGGYQKFKVTVLSYACFCLGIMGCPANLWFAGEAYWENIHTSMGDQYANTLQSLMPSWMMYVGFALLFVGGILGALLGHKMLKKHFGRAGIV